MELINKEIPGIIISNEDEEYIDFSKNKGRYRVYIPSYMQHSGLDSVIWCKNHIHQYRYGATETGEIYGEYKPLLKGTHVIIKFFANLSSCGYIDRIISDHVENCLPFGVEYKDQSEINVLLRTPKHHNLIAILEDTQTEEIPNNSFHIYYDDKQVRIVLNEDGMYTWVTKDQFLRVLQNKTCWIEENNKYFIDGNNQYVIEENNTLCVKGNNKVIVLGKNEEIVEGNQHEEYNQEKECRIRGKNSLEVFDNSNMKIHKIYNEHIEQDFNSYVGQTQKNNIEQNQENKIGNNQKTEIGNNQENKIGNNQETEIGSSGIIKAGSVYKINAPRIELNC